MINTLKNLNRITLIFFHVAKETKNKKQKPARKILAYNMC